MGIEMHFLTAGNLAESFSPSPAIHLSNGQARSSTWMLYYALVSPIFSNSAHLQICAKFKQYSQIGEYFCKKLYLLYIKLLFCKLWGIYFLF